MKPHLSTADKDDLEVADVAPTDENQADEDQAGENTDGENPFAATDAGHNGEPAAAATVPPPNRLLFPARRVARAVMIVLLVLVLAGAGTNLVLRRLAELPAGVAFRADGVDITVQELQHRIALMEFVYGLQKPSGGVQLDEFNRDVAKALAVSQIVDDAAQARGIVIADKTASDQLNSLVKDNSWGDMTTLVKTLAQKGLSEQDVLDEIRREQASARLFGDLTASMKATTDAQAQQYYNQNKARMVSPEQRTISNVVVSTQAQANQVAQLVRSGSNFADLATQYSTDGSTKNNGGSLGAVTESELESGYAKAAFQAQNNTVFGPVKTPQGWNVGKVTAIQPAVPLNFAQTKQAIETKLDNDAKIKVWDAFLTKQIQAADVVYAPQYQPADPDSPPPADTTS